MCFGAAHLLLCRAHRFAARFFHAVSNAIDFDQHVGSVAEIAADGRARGIWLEKRRA
jgi:hypothetical protein